MEKRSELPTEQDFDPYGGDLDAQCAWKKFGGLTLDEAHVKFREHPECYREELMAMGGKAFSYYFPVIDSYIRETELLPEGVRDDRETWIIPHGLIYQFSGWNEPYVRHLRKDVLRLCVFVRSNLVLFADSQDEEKEIDEQWEALEVHLGKKDS